MAQRLSTQSLASRIDRRREWVYHDQRCGKNAAISRRKWRRAHMATDHLDGKRTGRPRGSKTRARSTNLRRDILWAYENLSRFTLSDGKVVLIGEHAPKPPSPGATHWIR